MRTNHQTFTRISMSEQSPIIRASDVGQFTYCRRAWWLAQQGHENRNTAAMAVGTTVHEKHNRSVATAQRTRTLALLLLGLGALLALIVILSQLSLF